MSKRHACVGLAVAATLLASGCYCCHPRRTVVATPAVVGGAPAACCPTPAPAPVAGGTAIPPPVPIPGGTTAPPGAGGGF